jgi:flotillin
MLSQATATLGLMFWLVIVAAVAVFIIMKKLLYVCAPNKVLIFSGRTRNSHGRSFGYRILRGGRTVRIPILEVVDEIDLSNMTLELSVPNAYTKGGVPLSVQAVANVKVPGEEPLIHNTLERFLGYSREQIMDVSKQTLEGNLRGVLATLTPEEVNEDMLRFLDELTKEAHHDLEKLGLVLDNLKIQNVTDDVGYLTSIGRVRSASVRKNAAVAEANAQAEAAENKWRNTAQAELSKIDAQVQIAFKQNERRIAEARSRREALIAEERADVQAELAQSQAELALQDARIEQVRLRLQAEIVAPAEAKRLESEALAKGAAARIIAQGQATARVLSELAREYQAKGDAGRDVLLMQKLIPLIQRVVEPLSALRIDRLTVVGGGTNDESPLAGKLIGTNEQVKAATGVDLAKVLRERLGGGAG